MATRSTAFSARNTGKSERGMRSSANAQEGSSSVGERPIISIVNQTKAGAASRRASAVAAAGAKAGTSALGFSGKHTSAVNFSGRSTYELNANARKYSRKNLGQSLLDMAGVVIGLDGAGVDEKLLPDSKAAETTDGLTGEDRLEKMLKKSASMEGLVKYTMAGSASELRRHGISMDILQSAIIEDETQLSAVMSFPSTILFFCFFMLFFQQHYATSFIHVQEENIRQKLAASAYQVSTVTEIYGWMDNYLIPYLWSTDRMLGQVDTSSLPVTSGGGGGSGQQLVGGFLVRSQRSMTEPCEDEIVKDRYVCNDVGKTNATGHSIQQDATGVFLNGWTHSASTEWRRLSEIGGHYSRRSADPSTWFESCAGFFSNWMWSTNPVKTSTEDVWKSWKEEDRRKTNSQDGLVETVSRSDTRDDWGDVEDAQANIPTSRTRPLKNVKYWRKPTSWNPLGPMRRVFDPWTHRAARSENSTSFKRKGRELRQTRPEFGMGGWIPASYDFTDVWEYIMPMSSTQPDVTSTVASWRNAKVIDRSNLVFSVEAILRNKEIGEGLVTHTFVNFLFSRGGHIYVDFQMVSLVLADRNMVLLWAGGWIFLLLLYTMGTPARACAAWRRGKLTVHLQRSSNLAEWVLMLYGWIIVIVFGMERFGTMKFNDHYEDYRKINRVPLQGQTSAYYSSFDASLKSTDIEWYGKIRKNLYNTGLIDITVQTFVAWYHLVMIVRFFVASRGQPRLAIVVNTIRDAAVDLLHLFMVFGIIFWAYVVSGYILFGRRMGRLSTVPGAAAYAIQIVLMKEFEFQELTAQDFWTSVFWIVTFVVLVVLILVNIVLAMIFDTYGEVRGQVSDHDSLAFTFKRIVAQIKHAKVWVNNTQLLMATRRMGMESVRSDQLRAQIPGLGETQLSYIFAKAKDKIEVMMMKGNKNALPEAVASVLLGIRQLKDGVAVMRRGLPSAKSPASDRFSCDSMTGQSSMASLADGGPASPRGAGSAAAMVSGSASDSAPFTSSAMVHGSSSSSAVVPGRHESVPGMYDSMQVGVVIESRAPDGQPLWLKDGLMPFLRRQQKFLDQVHTDINEVEKWMHDHGVGAGTATSRIPRAVDPRDENDVTVLPWTEQDKRSSPNEGVGRPQALAPAPPVSDVPETGVGKKHHVVTNEVWA